MWSEHNGGDIKSVGIQRKHLTTALAVGCFLGWINGKNPTQSATDSPCVVARAMLQKNESRCNIAMREMLKKRLNNGVFGGALQARLQEYD